MKERDRQFKEERESEIKPKNAYDWYKSYIDDGKVEDLCFTYLSNYLDDLESGIKHVGKLNSEEAQDYKTSLEDRADEVHHYLEKAYHNWMRRDFGQVFEFGSEEYFKAFDGLPSTDSKYKGLSHFTKMCDYHGGWEKMAKKILEDDNDEKD